MPCFSLKVRNEECPYLQIPYEGGIDSNAFLLVRIIHDLEKVCIFSL